MLKNIIEFQIAKWQTLNDSIISFITREWEMSTLMRAEHAYIHLREI